MGPINVYAIVAPAVLIMIAVEFIYCLVKKNGYYSYQDSVMGMGTMILAQCVNVVVASAVVVMYGYIYDHYALFHFEPTLLHFIISYLAADFLFYWFHRAGHRINLFWAMHVPHHSAEELNYAVGLRASLTQRAASFLFYWPLAFLGFPPSLILTVVAINLVYQLVPHTRVIGRLPRWIESWLNTPYHHRVHHAANPVYWDKNFGGTLIIWDKLFGSFQHEVEPIYYGVTIHPKSWDPTYLNFHWFAVLWNDQKQATHFADKLKIWFMPPGWRPRNLPAYPQKPALLEKNQIKYRTTALVGTKLYLVFQIAFNLAILNLVIKTDSPLSFLEKCLVSFMLWVSITIWAAILESKAWAKNAELIRIVLFSILLGSIFSVHQFEQFKLAALYGLFGFCFFWVLTQVKPSSAS